MPGPTNTGGGGVSAPVLAKAGLDPAGYKAAPNPLAAFANSDMGKTVSALSAYGPTGMPDYSAAFQTALQAARGNISQQLHGALSDIAQSQARAGEALGTYAPLVNADYAEGMGNANSAVNAIQAANAKAGIHTLMAPGAILAPDRTAVAGTHAEDLANEALLRTGIGQAAAHDTSLANLAALQAQGGLDQSALQFQQQQASNAQQNQYQTEADKQKFLYGLVGQAQAAALSNKTAATTQPATRDPKIAEAYTRNGVDNATANTIHADPEYARLNTYINDPTSNPWMVYNMLKSKPKLLAVLKAENPDYFSSATIAAAKALGAASTDTSTGPGPMGGIGNAISSIGSWDRRAHGMRR